MGLEYPDQPISGNGKTATSSETLSIISRLDARVRRLCSEAIEKAHFWFKWGHNSRYRKRDHLLWLEVPGNRRIWHQNERETHPSGWRCHFWNDNRLRRLSNSYCGCRWFSIWILDLPFVLGRIWRGNDQPSDPSRKSSWFPWKIPKQYWERFEKK